MEEKKGKKKKLTLSVSTTKPYSPSFKQTGKKKSVIIEKRSQRRGAERRFTEKNDNLNRAKTKTTDFKAKNFVDKRNFEIRKLAEERATKRFKHSRVGEGLQSKKIKTLKDFAELSTDELIGGYDEKKGKRFKIDGYLEEFALSKNEADDLIMNARSIIYK